MNQEQQKRLDIALAWRDKGAASIQFDAGSATEHRVTSVQFHSEVVLQKSQPEKK